VAAKRKDEGTWLDAVNDEEEAAPRAPVTPRLLTRLEAATYLHVSLRSFENHVLGSIAHVRIGTKCLFETADLDRWIEEHKVGGPVREAARSGLGSASRARELDMPSMRAIREKLRRPPRRPTKLVPIEGNDGGTEE
jgi:excisionase family DNA binding protein